MKTKIAAIVIIFLLLGGVIYNQIKIIKLQKEIAGNAENIDLLAKGFAMLVQFHKK